MAAISSRITSLRLSRESDGREFGRDIERLRIGGSAVLSQAAVPV